MKASTGGCNTESGLQLYDGSAAKTSEMGNPPYRYSSLLKETSKLSTLATADSCKTRKQAQMRYCTSIASHRESTANKPERLLLSNLVDT